MSKPAARLTDMHACPMQTPAVVPIPHVGGPIMFQGAPTVLINGLPAARVGDVAMCVGPPDVIVAGSPTCLIGGIPAARMGDQTAHGGTIVAGSPNVTIGDSGGGAGGAAGFTMAAAKAKGLAFTRTDCASQGAQEVVAASRFVPPPPDPTQLHWIEIALVDDDGNPMVGEPYELQLGENEPIAGLLDGRGRARHDGIEPGSYHVTFLNLEDRAVRADGGDEGEAIAADERTEPLEHVLQPGEHTAVVSTQAQFRSWRTVWEDSANNDLRKERVNPFTLMPSDQLLAPPRKLRRFSRSADQEHSFIGTAPALLLNLKILDADRMPMADRTARIVLGTGGDGAAVDGVVGNTTDGDGRLSQALSHTHRAGELAVHEPAAERPPDDEVEPPADSPAELTLWMRIGELAPANTIRGVQMRLNNLGYFAGFAVEDEVQLRWATEEFEFDHKMKVTGKFDDPKVYNRIAHEHGDLLPDETVP